MFDSSFIDPYNLTDAPAHLVNIATGAVASPAIEESMVNALDTGASMLTKFVRERLVEPSTEADRGKKSLYDILPRSNVKTTTGMKRSVKVKKRAVTMDGEIMYLRLLAVNSRKKVPLSRVMSFENAPVPLSMFTEDGKITTFVRSQLVPCLEGLVESETINTIPKCDAFIFDGHACIQMMNIPQISEAVTFEEMASRFFAFVLKTSKLSNNGNSVAQLHIVFDRYLKDSIKGQTRQKRIAACQGNIHRVRPDIRIPANWKQFLGNEENKTSLAEYYCSYMCDNNALLTVDQTLTSSGGQGEETVYADHTSVSDLPDLRSNQEEADTRIIMHAVEAARKGAETIVVSSPDTDVLVLLLHHRTQIEAECIYFLTGRAGMHASLTRYIPVHDIHHTTATITPSCLLLNRL
ncbi:MAG: hypothetical protein N0C90_06120 [Candidatus Thiodiazotropha endolucinida]|nr:hypothetical protein [Candidatus Thiodiazotropha taylori]MCW4260925.1 hypothetical protein [Candidatus Thiodiazotropha endolucinida]